MLRFIKIISCFLLLSYPFQANAIVVAYQFKSNEIAAYETKMWKAYYERNYQSLLHALVSMLSQQFKLSAVDSFSIAGSAVQAARLFAQMPARSTQQQYNEKVLPSLILFYTELKNAVDGDWDPATAAKAELNWWIARRTPGKNSPKQVGQAIAKLYVIFYGKHNKQIAKAGLLRAKAADLRDRQSRRGRIDWLRIQNLLTQSYTSLQQGIKQSKE